MNIHVYLLVLLLAQGAPRLELVFLNLQSQQKCGPDLVKYVINESQMGVAHTCNAAFRN